MLNIKEDQLKKVAFGLGGLAAGTLAMKTIEKALGTPTVAGFLGLDGVSTLMDIAPPLVVGIIGTGFFAKNSKKDIGYIGLGAAMAAGAKVIEKVANKTIFSGLEATDVEYVEGAEYYPETYSGASLDEVEGISIDDVL